MFTASLIIFAFVLLSRPVVQVSQTRELARPHSIYLGYTIIGLVALWWIVPLPESIAVWAGLIILLIGIIGTFSLSEAKSSHISNMEQEKSFLDRILDVIARVITTGVIFTVLYALCLGMYDIFIGI